LLEWHLSGEIPGNQEEVLVMKEINEIIGNTINERRQSLAEQIVARQYEQQPAPVTPPFICDHQPLADLAKQYMNTLLQGDRNHAIRLITDAVDNGIDVKDIYFQVFQTSHYEIGRLWLQNKISVAQEHYCSAGTQMIMSQLYPHIFNTNRTGRRLVAACVEGELHQIGIRMVADFFEMEGWDTYYLGANTPGKAILQAVQNQEADILGVYLTMNFHRSTLEDLVNRVRQSETGKKIKILVGGYIFQKTPDLWKKLEVDGWAADAREAVNAANRLLDIKT